MGGLYTTPDAAIISNFKNHKWNNMRATASTLHQQIESKEAMK